MLHGRNSDGWFRLSRRWCAAVLVAAVTVVAAPGVLAAAQTRIGLNGGRPSEWPFLAPVLAGQGLTQQGWLDFASRVGENWLPNTAPVPLDYPGQLGIVSGANALTADQSTAVGQQLLHQVILDNLAAGPVAVAGLSEGTLVIDKELSYLATLAKADAPSRDALTFYVFGDMLRGLGQTYLRGLTIPLIGQTFGPVPETQYDTVVVNEQWDGWANPPDRPWNLLAVVNAVMGAVYTVNGANDHSQTSLDSLADAVKVSQITNSLGGTTTTYMIPRQQLPLTRPLRQIGIPDWVVDEIDTLLRPWILTGYSAMTPYLGPHVEQGQLVWTSAPAPAVQPAVTAQQGVVLPAGTGIAPADASSLDYRQPAVVDGQRHRQLSDPADAGGSLVDDPENGDGQSTPPTAGSDDAADVEHPHGQPVDATDGGGSRLDDPDTGTAPVPPTTPARGPVDSTGGTHPAQQDPHPAGAADAGVDGSVHSEREGGAGQGQVKPRGAGGAGNGSADGSPHAESGAAQD